MTDALYGPGGFFTHQPGGSGHFATSAQAGARFADPLGQLLDRLDHALGHPDPLDVVDIGAGRGELLTHLLASVGARTAARLRPTAVELHPPVPSGPPDGDRLRWRDRPPRTVHGLLLATEWLDNVPVDVAEVAPDGTARYVLVDDTGAQALGGPVRGEDRAWLRRWWPSPATPGTRAEIGLPRDLAWAAAVGTVTDGLALAVDYGHLRGQRPAAGTLAGHRAGRQVPPVPDGRADITAHVALDAVAAAGHQAARIQPHPPTGDDRPVLTTQARALRALGLSGTRPPRELAERDPHAYLARLAAAGAAAELTDPAGYGGHHWLLQPAGRASAVRWCATVAGWRT